ncbi:MAG: DUF885 domain-containing protein [Acidobacteriota bacterium]
MAQDQFFYRIAERYLDDMLRINPSTATVNGYHRFDGLLEDFSKPGIRKRIELYEKYLADFQRLDHESLSLSARIDHGILINDIESTLFTLKELKPYENDPALYNDIIGFGMLFLTIQEEDSPVWPERLQSMLDRMRKIPEFLEIARKNLKNPPKVHTLYIIERNPANIAFFDETLSSIFDKAPAIENDLIEARDEALKALRDYQMFLETELLPRSNGNWRLGKDLWRKKLQFTLQSDIKPDEIVERAQQLLKKWREEMLEIALPIHDRLFPGCRHVEQGNALINAVVREVIHKISKKHATSDTVFSDVQMWIGKIKSHIREKGIITLPPETDNFFVERTPGFLNGLAVAYFNPAPVFEPQLKKSYWISSLPKTGDAEKDRKQEESHFREYNDYGLQSLTIHEAFPGHYVQYYYAQNSPMATIYKKIFPSWTFSEGWAVLGEEQIFESGYGSEDPAALLIHTKINLKTPINAILDATLHTSNMGDEEADQWAIDLLMNQGFQEEMEAHGKLRRAKMTSCQLSTYLVGYLELKEIMEEYRMRKGNHFNLREFNETLLSFGTIPPREIRKLLFESLKT